MKENARRPPFILQPSALILTRLLLPQRDLPHPLLLVDVPALALAALVAVELRQLGRPKLILHAADGRAAVVEPHGRERPDHVPRQLGQPPLAVVRLVLDAQGLV